MILFHLTPRFGQCHQIAYITYPKRHKNYTDFCHQIAYITYPFVYIFAAFFHRFNRVSSLSAASVFKSNCMSLFFEYWTQSQTVDWLIHEVGGSWLGTLEITDAKNCAWSGKNIECTTDNTEEQVWQKYLSKHYDYHALQEWGSIASFNLLYIFASCACIFCSI